MRKKPNNPQISQWIVASLVLHAGFLAAYALLSSYEPQYLDDKHIINISIVQKGKKRDESLLPREVAEIDPVSTANEDTQKAEPQVPEVQKEVKVEKHIVAAKPETPKKAGPQKVSALDALKKRVTELEKEGDPEGSEYGNSLTGDLAENYEQLVRARLIEKFKLPRYISESEAKKLKMKVRIHLNGNGKPLKAIRVLASKNSEYDNAVIALVDSIEPFGDPPNQLKAKYLREGLIVTMCPAKDCPK